MAIPEIIQKELDDSGLPYEIERGGRHDKIKMGGRLAGILPRSLNENGRGARNVRAQVRRMARDLKSGKGQAK